MTAPTATTSTSTTPRMAATTQAVRTDVESEISAAVDELADGRTTRARVRLSALWERDAHEQTDHRAAIAHWLADAQGDVESALTWDERAVDEAEALADKRVPFAGTARTVAAMLPLLHVEVAQDYRRLGSACGALEHLAAARNALAALPQPERGAPAREIARLDAQLGGRAPAPGRQRHGGQGEGWRRQSWEGRAFWDQEFEEEEFGEQDDPLD